MNWLSKASIVVVCLLVLFSQTIKSNESTSGYTSPKVSVTEEDIVSLAPYATFYEDQEHVLTPDLIHSSSQLNGFRSSDLAPNFGHSRAVYWLSVDIQNPLATDIEQVVSLASPMSDLVSFYVIKNGLISDSYTTGDRVPFNIRRIPDPNPSLLLKLEPHSTTTVLIRQESTSPIIFNATLSSPLIFHERHLKATAATMFYFGILTLTMILSAYAFWLTKEKVFASYSGFILSRLILQASITGYAFQYLFYNAPSIQNLNIVIFACATILCFALFTKQLLDVRGSRNTLLTVLMLMCIVPFFLMFSDYQTALIFTKVLALVSLLSFLAMAYHYAQQGLQIAKYYLISMSVLLLTTGYYLLSRFTLLPYNDMVEFLLQAGTVLEVLLLVILVAIRFEQEAKQRAMAEIQALKHSEETNLLEQQLQHRAFHHAKNHLPNDVFFHQAYRTMHTTIGFTSHAVVFIKVHKLKEFDKTLGTKSSDRLSQHLAEHINTILRPYPSIVSIEQSGHGPVKIAALDQASFVFLADVDSEQKIATLARSIAERLKQPFTFEAINLDLDAHLGIAFSQHGPAQSSEPASYLDELIRKAKIAGSQAYQKKRLFQSYNEEEDLFNEARLSLAAELRLALENQELTLAYQPQLSLTDKRCVGLEALLRWENPQLGQVSPEEFVSVAEHNGLIKPLTLWVINKALREMVEINKQHTGLQFSINISVLNLHEPGFVEAVSDALIKNQVSPGQLTLEITESSIISDDFQELKTLEELKALGIKLSIDDFGTGFSGLSQIHKLSVHELKIDKSFIFDVTHKHSAETIVKASINIGHDLEMKVVAEGIEDEETETLLRQLGCDIGQGYFYARPMNKEKTLQWLETHKDLEEVV
ncbi:EAL domain-containing protein [Litoribrevibacter albus]|uniref:EAL domain-containing protein n=1 Tax=Litoribrevibacter albus TaxID=1473156 RepID=A0AA37S6N3_9GAMM|nr:EAL domain-containing protein [Litoribrevibacter albus]GLQ30150.1 hypothetical protein GCM10007876_06280 [Litoribrevibacter albus]